jgi:hypothetical protein
MPDVLTPPSAGIADSPLYSLCINAEWWSHISGKIRELAYRDAWEGTDTEVEDAIQVIYKLLDVGVPTSDCEGDVTIQYPQQATLWHDQATVLTGAPLTMASDTNNYYHIYAYQASGTDGDSFAQPFLLDAGDYVFHVLGGGSNLCGKMDWYLDAESSPFLAGQDWYTASPTPNIFQTGTLTIASAGQHTLKGVMNGKNASSFAYVAPLTKYWFERVP